MSDASSLQVVLYPHPALRCKAVAVTEINAALKSIVARMFELMYTHKGIGLAATQVGLPYRVFVLNLSGDPTDKEAEEVFINPVILKRKGAEEDEEGCLSVPGFYAQVRRPKEIVVEAFNLQGECFEFTLDELAARAVQHEIDHLDGVLFTDKVIADDQPKAKAVLIDFETAFRKQQAEGVVPSDDQLKERLQQLSQGAPAV